MTASITQFLADGTESQDDVQVLSGLLVEQFHQVLTSVDDLLLLLGGKYSHLAQNLFVILRTPHVGHLSSIEDIVEILQETLLDNLSVREHESNWFVLASCLQQCLQVVFPLRVLVDLSNLDGKDLEVSDAGG